MITPDEIRHKARELGIATTSVQRDYIFGWLIAGIFGDSPLGRQLILKGGNALRKAYFPTGRYSDDLDFTTESSLEPESLINALNQVCRMVEARSGVQFDIDRNNIADSYTISKDKRVYKARLYFKNFEHEDSHMTLKVNMDVTDNDRLYLPTRERFLIHAYSDAETLRVALRCIALEEAMADKLKCLLQRRYSHDLHDLVYAVFVNNELDIDRSELVRILLKKTIFEPSPFALKNLLLSVPFNVFKRYWDRIVCPSSTRFPLDHAVALFTSGLDELFAPFNYGERAAVAYFPAELRNPILKAGSEKTLLRLRYDGVARLVEPYSLVFKRRKSDGVGQEYFYVHDRVGGASGPGIKALFHWKITELENTQEQFEPQYEIELAKAGEPGRSGYFKQSFGQRSMDVRVRRPGRAFSTAPTFVVRCPYCGREFRRSRPNVTIKKHNDQYGNLCYGRRGQLDY